MASEDIQNKYKKHNLRDHIYEIPGMYVGSVDISPLQTYVFDEESKRMVLKDLQVVPALYKIVDEVVVNALDQWVRMKTDPKDDSKPVKNIKIYVDKESGVIEVLNDGDSIDVEKHPAYENVYIPEMIFGQLLTSTNYDKGKDGKESVVSGVHGLGVKLCNVFSKEFSIDLVDHRRKKHYTQKWTNNMKTTEAPGIKYCAKLPYTRVKFLPDYERFGMTGLTDDMFALIKKRAYDACACTDNTVSIYFNDEKIEVKDFEKYVDLFIGDKNERPRAFEKVNDRWEIVATYSTTHQFEQTSFVNGINTFQGGKHVEYITNQITKKLAEIIQSKKKKEVKPQHIKENLMVFVKCLIVNPSFNSQTKEQMTSPVGKFGSKCELGEKFMTALFKTGIVEKVVSLADFHDEKKLTKTDGKKKSTITGIPTLDDANWAGTAKSRECTLILTEGLSAKTMAISGLSVVGRDKWGVFPLRGKVMNVKDATAKKIYENEEITQIKKILGLESGKVYKSVDELRYGRVMALCDADADAYHIKGLIMNLFHSLWPSLVATEGFQFLCSMVTPIIKVFKGKEVKSFYTLTDFENWKKENNNAKGWTIKYYKGLGTSTEQEAVEYFKEMKTVTYKWSQGQPSPSAESLDLAFNKARADDRKAWLGQYDRQRILDVADKEVTYEDFVHKELIHFSNYDLERSIPNICDGLKVSQRKILYSCIKRGLWADSKEIRVAQLASYTSEQSAYHHGEASLQGAITAMAQDFVGSNNINLLQPRGQFGSKLSGGKDASQPRYIYTLLMDIVPKIFVKEDFELLKYLEDDGYPVEPEFYMPILPMILVNGAVGIGTGFSTNIPCYNPYDIVSVLRKLIRGDEVSDSVDDDLQPWYRGFEGDITKVKGKWTSRGVYKKIGATKLEITELPVGTWTDDYKEMLENMVADEKSPVKSYESQCTARKVHFTVQFSNSDALEDIEKLETQMKLVSTKNLSVGNMYAFNEKGQITYYETAVKIIKEFYKVRLVYYEKRRENILDRMRREIKKLNNKIRFIQDVIAGVIIVHKLKKAELEAKLEELEYDLYEDSYDYLTKIPIYNFTVDKVQELQDDIKKKEALIMEVENMTAGDMWLKDLDDFEASYDKFLEEVQEDNAELAKKSATKKTKLSIKKPAAATKEAAEKAPKKVSLKIKK